MRDNELHMENTKKLVSDRVVEYIHNEIKEGNLKAGEKLPSEDVLADKLNVSRVSLREALKELRTVGLIETQHGKGSFISSNPSLDAFRKLIPPLALSSNRDIAQLLEARRFVEIGTARLAATNASQENLEPLQECIEEMKISLEEGDLEKFQQNDLDFHLKVADISNNEILYKLLQTLRDIMLDELNVILKIPGRMESSLKLHKDILKAIKENDSRKAARKIDTHILNAKKDFEESAKDNI